MRQTTPAMILIMTANEGSGVTNAGAGENGAEEKPGVRENRGH